jgi:selenocysteine-specific elongation factor
MVIAPAEGGQRLSKAARLERLRAQDTPDAGKALSALLLAVPQGIALDDFIRSRNLTGEEAAQLGRSVDMHLVEDGDAMLALDAGHWPALLSRLRDTLADWHALHPDCIGPGDAVLMQAMRAHARPAVMRAAIRLALTQGTLVRDRRLLRLPGHSPRLLASDQELLDRAEPLLRAAGLRAPIVGELAAALGMERAALLSFFERISRLGYLEPVAPNRYFLPETVAALAAMAGELASASDDGEFDAAQYRNRTGIGRNLTIDVLEYLDRIGVTRYAGGRRRMAG